VDGGGQAEGGHTRPDRQGFARLEGRLIGRERGDERRGLGKAASPDADARKQPESAETAGDPPPFHGPPSRVLTGGRATIRPTQVVASFPTEDPGRFRVSDGGPRAGRPPSGQREWRWTMYRAPAGKSPAISLRSPVDHRTSTLSTR